MAEHEDSEVYVELDVGNLCVTNISLLKSSNERYIEEDILKHVATLGARKLIGEVFKLPSEYVDHVPVATLPKPKPLTKWQKFAQAKGISRKDKDRKVWDPVSEDWKPSYGYGSIKNQEDWIKEIPDNADPNIDLFEKDKKEKKERIAKNEYKRLQNIAASKVKVTNMESIDKADKHQLARSLRAAKTSTASLGRFADKLPKEKPPKDTMKKRKFKENIGDFKEEKENYQRIFESLDKKAPKLDVDQAVQHYITKPM
ncbi:ribosome biogenesis regulatory protein homolog [Trichonephila inaurata madagascariensis]|uniref:Ribosome biogenesis regulatory protein n=1 Tax=Trichonephila inaurata madagascariensis TaxID=2747483 RepID=A0A8X6M845_9ARAC|nr:ribosome biogenesis regulatory protein homolog [Trichonephila inaurata madagascariensis]